MSASFYDLIKYAKTGIASDGMTVFDKMKALAMCKAGFPVSTITGIPPITFTADGTPLTAWSISGASGGVGDLANMFDGIYHKAYVSAAGIYATPDSTTHTALVPCKPNTRYYIKKYSVSSKFRIACYTQKPVNGTAGTFIFNDDSATECSFITGNSDAYIAVYVDYANAPKSPNMSVTTDGYHDTFIGYGVYAIPVSCGGDTKTLYLLAPLDKGDTVTMQDTGVIITPAKGSNTLSIGTTLQPSEISITGHIKQ